MLWVMQGAASTLSAQGTENHLQSHCGCVQKNTDHADIHTTPANSLSILLNSMPLAMALSNNNLYIPVII